MTWVCDVHAERPEERRSVHDTEAEAEARARSYRHRTPPRHAVVWFLADPAGDDPGWRDGPVPEVERDVSERGWLGSGASRRLA